MHNYIVALSSVPPVSTAALACALRLLLAVLSCARDKFVTVEECANALTAAGLRPRTGGGVEGGPAIDISSVGGGFAATGMVYDPMSGEWTLGDDTGVNYLMCASKPYK